MVWQTVYQRPREASEELQRCGRRHRMNLLVHFGQLDHGIYSTHQAHTNTSTTRIASSTRRAQWCASSLGLQCANTSAPTEPTSHVVISKVWITDEVPIVPPRLNAWSLDDRMRTGVVPSVASYHISSCSVRTQYH